MKRAFISILLVVSLSVLFISTSSAQESQPTQPIGVANLFTWATGDSPDWGRGALYSCLGLLGALVTVFSLVGGAIPGTAGFARIEAGMKRVEEREKILDIMIKDPNKIAANIEVVEQAANNLRDDIRADRRRQFMTAAFLYAILGAFFAALLAQDLLQALIIGAGWTAYLGALGLKKDYAERKSLKDETTEKLENALSQASAGTPLSDNDHMALMSEAQVSKAI